MSSPEHPREAPSDGRVHPGRALLEGALAGALAGVVVALAHGATDLWVGEPLRTPSLLAVRLFGAGATTAGGVALFSVLHMALWVVAGIGSAWAVSLADARPRAWKSAFVVLSVFWISLLYLSGALSVREMGSLHLWLGTFLGAAVVAGVLVWRHPRILTQGERDRLTGVTRGHLREAWAYESDGLAAYRAAFERFHAPVLEQVAKRKADALQSVATVLERLEIEPPAPRTASFGADTLVGTLRNAIAREQKAIGLYDGFLASTDEPAPRHLLLHWRFEACDGAVPLLEDALREGG